MADLNQLLDEIKSATAALRANDDRVDALGTEVKNMLTTKLNELEAKYDREIAKLSQRPLLGAEDLKGAVSESHKSFIAWARKGDNAFHTIDRKSLTASDDSTGGYLASAETTNEIEKGIVEFSPIRQYARVRTTSSKSIKIRKRTGTFTAQWANDRSTTRTETTGLTWGVEEMPVHELYALVDISVDDLEDSDFNLEAELNTEFTEQFGVAEGTALVTGNAVGKPEGLMFNTSVTSYKNGHATDLSADALIKMYYDLPEAYARSAVWLAKRATLGVVRTLKDTAGSYIWQPPLAAGSPATILGQPYAESPDMPAIASGAYPILFGDLRRAYVIGDRIQISVTRDAVTQPGWVRFYARKRIGGQVVNAAALRKLLMSA